MGLEPVFSWGTSQEILERGKKDCDACPPCQPVGEARLALGDLLFPGEGVCSHVLDLSHRTSLDLKKIGRSLAPYVQIVCQQFTRWEEVV